MFNLSAFNQGRFNQPALVNVVDVSAGLDGLAGLAGEHILIRGYTAGLDGAATVGGAIGFNQQMTAGLIANAATSAKTRGVYSLARNLRGFGFVRLVFDVNVEIGANLKGFGGFTGVFADAILSGSLDAEAGLTGSYQRVQMLSAQMLSAEAAISNTDPFITGLFSANLRGRAWANLALVGDPNANVWLTARFLRATATITESFDPLRVFRPTLSAGATIEADFGRRRRLEGNTLFAQARFVSVVPQALLDMGAMMEAGAELAANISANLTLKPRLPNFQGNASISAGPDIERRGAVNMAGEAGFVGADMVLNRGFSAWLESAATFTGEVDFFTNHPLSTVLTATATVEGQEIRLAEQFAGTLSAEGAFNGLPVAVLTYSADLDASAAKMAGFITNPFFSAPAGRIIDVIPKDRQLFVLPKNRVIEFAGDDRGLSMETRVKQPREVVDYDIDMREWFKLLPGDSLASVDLFIDIQSDADDLEAGPGVLPDTVLIGDTNPQICKVWLGGGRDGVDYKVTAVLTTNGGRVEEVDFIVRVIEQ